METYESGPQGAIPATKKDIEELLQDGIKATKGDKCGLERLLESSAAFPESMELMQIIKSNPAIPEILRKAEKINQHIDLVHPVEVAQGAVFVARKMELSLEDKKLFVTAALLHDIGKIFIPESILKKQEKLTEEEREVVKEHSQTGFEFVGSWEEMDEVAQILRMHHEFKLGGYPRDRFGGNENRRMVLLSKISPEGDRRKKDRRTEGSKKIGESERRERNEKFARWLFIADVMHATSDTSRSYNSTGEAVLFRQKELAFFKHSSEGQKIIALLEEWEYDKRKREQGGAIPDIGKKEKSQPPMQDAIFDKNRTGKDANFSVAVPSN